MNVFNKIKPYIQASFDILDSYLYDARRYCTHSQAIGRFRSPTTARAFMMMTAHSLEKGLSYETKRQGFGKEKCLELIECANTYQLKFGHDAICDYVLEVVEDVVRCNETFGCDFEVIKLHIKEYKSKSIRLTFDSNRPGGVIRVKKNDILKHAPTDPYKFFHSRHSIRTFKSLSLSESLIFEATSIAQSAPSVCNRQCSRVYYTSDRDLISQLLKLQGGAGGFMDEIPTLIIISSSLSVFNRAAERNQAFIDGGIFAMNLSLAFHSIGCGSCFLNWSAPAWKDREVRNIVNIPNSETIISFLAAGYLKDDYYVSSSPRLPLKSVVSQLARKSN